MRRAAGIVTCARPAGIGPRSPGTGRSGPASAGRGASLPRRGSWGTAVRPWAWLCLDGSGPRGSLFSRGADGVGGPGPWWSHLDGRSVPRQPGRPKPSRMEVLDEFDSEFPQSVAFCQLISEEDFERQAVTYTERALRRLFRSIDRNPALAERVAKFSSAIQGELNCCNSMGAREMHRRLEQLKRRIHRVHLYSQDAKKKRRKPKAKKPEPIILRDQSTSPCLPPTLLPPPPLPPPATTVTSMVAPSPPVYTMPRVFGPFPPLPSTSVEKLEASESEVKLNWTGLPSNPKSRMVDLTPLVLNPGGFHFSYLARNSMPKLHCPRFPWTAACSGLPSTEEMPSPSVKASIFTPPVLLKFQPVPHPQDDSENDPGSVEPVPYQRDP
uniref:Uncharacterized protein n=1 Tax=Sus scrofa TaxID=9823 RepID=A0A8D0U3Z0_PIG